MPSPFWFRVPSFWCLLPGLLTVSAAAQQVQYSTAHHNGERALPQTLTGGTSALRAKLNASRSGISLALADFDSDGSPDLLTGYAIGDGGALTLQRGSSSATAPSASDFAAMQRGELVTPFAASAKTFALPVHPDFLKAADIDGNGTIDILVAARGDSNIYVMQGDGKGGFAAPQAIPSAGAISALTTWRGPGGANFIAAGVCTSSSSCALQLLASDGSTLASVPMSAAPSAIEVAPLNAGAYSDLAVAAGGTVALVEGDSVAAAGARVESLPVSGAVALATGNFVYDRRGLLQFAVLGADATLHVLVRSGVDNTTATPADVLAKRQAMRSGLKPQAAANKLTGTSWTEAETLRNVGPGSAAAIMFRSRLTGGGYDDLAVLAGSQFITVAHPFSVADGIGRTTPTVIIDSSTSVVTAALPARISPDARLGVITADRSAQPNIAVPPTNKTFTVTTTVDGTHTTTCTGGATCSIRDAVALANADHTANGLTKVDTINIPAGTYTFTTAFHPANDSGGNINYHYDLDGSMNLIGAGAGNTFLNGATLDRIFSGDSGIVNALAPYDVFITSLTMENGTNNNNPASATNFYGGLMDWESYGPGNLTFSNVTLVNGIAPLSPGGGLYASNSNDSSSNATEGLVEIDNSTFSSNTSPEQGGGVFLGSGTPALLNNDTFTGNTAVITGSSDPAKDGSGGALYTYGSQATGLTTITGSTFSGNTATDSGGGAVIFGGAVISNSTFQGNTAGAYGGGLYYIPGIPASSTITSSTFTSNSVVGSSGQTYGGVHAIDGGGICTESYGTTAGSQYGALGIHYSRIHGNSGGNATGLAVGCASGANQYATVNATDNWWGCNGAATGTGCDTALAASPATQTLTLTPFSKLIVSLSSTTPPDGSALTATGSLGQDSSGTVYTVAQNAALIGQPATLTIVQTGGTTNTNTSPLDANASIASTTNVTIPGAGTANVTVDGTTVTANFTVVAPDLTVTSAHTGVFVAGSTGDTYMLIATNSGTAATAGQVTVVDTLPSGFLATNLSGSGWSCTLATLTCTNSTAVAASSSFNPITLTVSVGSGQAAGIVNNVVSVNGGNEVNTANDTYTDPTQVDTPPALALAFNPTGIPVNGTSALYFTVTIPANDNSVSGIGFIATLPTNLKISTPNGLTGSCGGGAISAPAGGATVTLAGSTLAAGATCTFGVNVTSGTLGSYTVTTNAISSTNAGTGSTASATLLVAAAPTNVLAFGATSIPLNGSTSLSVTIGNPNSFTSFTGLQFSDALPPGLVVATPNALSNTCGGTVTATTGSSAFTLAGGTVAASSTCVVSINITGTTAGAKTTGESVSSNEGGATTSNIPSINVVQPLTAAISFSPTSILVGANSTLTFTLTNNATVSQTGVAISDTLPAGLVVASPNGFSGSCGGSGSAIAGGTVISLSGGTVAAGSPCLLTVNVTGNTAGAYTDTTGAVSSTTGGTGLAASANLTVIGAPTTVEAFAPSSVAPNSNSQLTFVFTNPNAGTALTGLSFTDTLPTNLKLATPSNLVNSCGGAATGSNGGSSITLTGGGIAAGSSCAVTANVLSATAGSYVNTTSTVSSTNGGTGAAATAALNVLAPPTIAVGFGASPIPYNGSTTLSFIITNPNTGAGLTGVALSDTLPGGLVVASPNGITGTCGGGTFTAAPGGTSITLTGGSLAAGANCPLSVNVTGTSSGMKTDSATPSATTAGAGASGSANITVALPASKLVFGTAPATPISTGGNAGIVTVQEEDSTSAVVAGASDTITLTVTAPGAASTSTYSVAAVNGVATFNLTGVPLTISGSYTYTATFSTLTTAQTTETVNTGAVRSFTVAGSATLTAPNTADSVVVTAVDAYGNKVTTYTGTVHFTSTNTSATLPADYTFAGGDAGVHTFTVFFGAAGTYSLTVTDTVASSVTGTETGIVVADAIWLINSNATLDRLTDVGVQTFTSGTAGTVAAHAAIAFDNTGAAWAVTNTSNSVLEYSSTGIAIAVSGSAAAGVNAPASLAIDGLGSVWVANGNNTVSVVTNAGAAVSPSTGYQGGSLSTPTGIIVDNAGSVWVTNSGNNSVTKFIGAAAPVTTPVVTNTSNNTLGTRP